MSNLGEDGLVFAFAKLAEIVSEWRAAGRITTTAGIKPPLMDALGIASEKDLGFETWRDLIDAAVEAGVIQTKRAPTGHVVVLLPGESIIATPVPTKSSDVHRPPKTLLPEDGPQPRLRPDVWSVFIDWSRDHRRLFDKSTARAFMYPVDADGNPEWVGNPQRFAQVVPVTPEIQREWMKEWASTLEEPDRESVLSSLAPNAELGAFRRELSMLGLTADWRAELQKRAISHAQQWAESVQIKWSDLLDHRNFQPTPTPPKPALGVRSAGGSNLGVAGSERRPKPPFGGSEVDQLRALVHKVIDQMSLTELSALPIRAEHLLPGSR